MVAQRSRRQPTSHRREVVYPNGLEAAIVRALEGVRDRRPYQSFIKYLLGRQELRSLGGNLTQEQVNAALHALHDSGKFDPTRFISSSSATTPRHGSRPVTRLVLASTH